MKEIKLKSGHTVLVDDSDYDLVRHISWRIRKSKNNVMYARSGWNIHISMHRFILGLSDPKIMVDHKDGNGLNNQRSNLRICNAAENNLNRAATGASKYRGVFLRTRGKKWGARIKIDGKPVHLGSFDDEIEAAKAFNKAAIATENPFRRLNEIQ